MTRSTLAYLLLVLAPTGALAIFAFRAAEQDYEEDLATYRARIGEEAEALARRIEAAIEDAARRAEAEEVVGFAKDGERLGYRPEGPAASDLAASPEDLRYFELCLRGGESFEWALKDPARAVDAYSFYVQRLRSPVLRARLAFRTARAALAAGNEPLGRAILDDLARIESSDAVEEGLPIDLLAALRLGDHDRLRSALRRREKDLPTALLGHLVRSLRYDDLVLRRAVEAREALEAAVRAHPEILRSKDAVLGDGCLLLARPHGAEGAAAATLRSIVRAPLDLPPLEAGGLEARLDRSAADAVRPEDAARWVRRSVRLGDSGPELAAVVVSDPLFEEERAALAGRRDLQRALVGLLAAATLGGGAALIAYLARERNLARLRSRLLANVSHELKTPITSIRMFSEMLAEDPLDEGRTRRFGEHLRAESQRLSGLIENLLDFSRLGRKDVDLLREPVDLSALLQQTAAGFAFRAREKGVEFHAEAEAARTVETNAGAVERIVTNLLDNALKYRGKAAPWIRLSVSEDEERVAIAVADNGIGIPRKDRERVFEEFYRVRYEDYAVQGSGLGLAIARRLARKLGGEITVASKVGAGSTFTLVLPKRRAP